MYVLRDSEDAREAASKPIEEVVAEAEELVADGVRELVVVAQDTSSYGIDTAVVRGWRNCSPGWIASRGWNGSG